MGRDGVDRDQDRVHAGDATHVGETKCDRHRSAGWNDVGGSGSTQGVATGEQGTETGQRDPEDGVGLFRPGGARPPTAALIGFIDEHQDRYGIEPICGVLPIVPSTYYAHQAPRRDPQRRSQRAKRDAALRLEIERVWAANLKVYGARKVWLQWNREAIPVARCSVARLMKAMGIQGVRRGRRMLTTLPDEAMERPRDAVNRHFKARRPNPLWVADLTDVASWQGCV